MPGGTRLPVPDRKVLYVCHNHPKVRAGGAETYAHELHLALRDTDGWQPIFMAKSGPPLSRSGRPHEDTYISPADGADDEYFLYADGFDFDWLYGTMRHDKALYTEHLRRFLRALQPDVVHFQHTLFIGYDAIREVRRTLPEAPIVYTLHEFLPICRAKGQMVRTMDDSLCDEETPRRCSECFPEHSPQTFFLRKRLIQAQLGLVDLFIAPSRLLVERYAAWGIPGDRILLEDYGRRLPPAPQSADGGRERRDRFGFFGQLSPYKGIDVLLGAMAWLGAGEAEAHLTVHGANLDLQDHSFRTEVERMLAAAGGRVTFAGPYEPGRVGELMEEIDWVVVPSIWWENSPLVIQEAFAARRPVICSDVGGMAEKVRDGVDGLHFAVGDPASLGECMARAAGNPALWERLRGGIRPVHAMDDHVRVITAAYDQLLERRRRWHAA